MPACTTLLHGSLELADVDLAGGIRVEEVERLADLVELLVGELTWLLLGGTTGHVECGVS